MLSVLFSSAAGGFLLRGQFRRIRFLLPAFVLFVAVGGRIELLGLAVGLLILLFEVPKKGVAPWLQWIAAALAAALLGFRIQFVTNPAGGYVQLNSVSMPLTVLWVLIILRSREELRRTLPRPALQIMIDLLLVLNAVLLALISPQTHASPIAFYLPFTLLGIVLATAITAYRGESLPPLHRTVAFGLALYGVSGVMKGPISLSLLAPLALISFPIMTTSQALLVQGLAGVRPKLLPRWFSERGYTQGSFSFLLLLLSSALALGVVLAVHCSPTHGMLVAGIVPVLIVAHLSRRKVSTWLTRRWAERIGGRSFLFDVGFHNLTLHEAVARAERMLLARERSHMIVTVNSVSLLKSRKDKTLLEIYRRADLVTADGVGIVWASRFLGLPLKGRVTGIDLAQSLLKRASVNGYRVFLLGGRKGVAERAARRLEKRFSGLDIVGTHHGYFDEAAGLLAAIKEAHPQILLVGMGAPKQERWMLKHVKELSVPLMIGVGGAFDLFAGDCRRAPLRWQQLGFEWLYRLLHEPWRIKEALAIPHFIGRVLAARTAVNLSTFIDLPGVEI